MERALPSTQDAWVDLVCADEELLRAEFEAIVAESWQSEDPPAPVRPVSPAHRPAAGLPRPEAGVGPAETVVLEHLPGRQRSPPCR
ncbi:hypothetical protein [Pedococcus sp. 5OH_020]|uniref:hypothetical protein n=1 Tax=Pedococcus sp. 5OH_020 TaxID=2989814 RepID=UPI0022EA0D94|nr:hypothetical protein [Pedococcus sp. 5OH_020]